MNLQKIAFITGVTGQDGSYLAEFLLKKGYHVHGLVRRTSTFNRGRIEHLRNKNPSGKNTFELHYGDLLDFQSIDSLITHIRPNEIYNLAAQSHVAVSFDTSEYTSQVNALGPLRVLQAIVANGLSETCRFYQASTSEMFGKVLETPQTETTPFSPRSPYAISKVSAYWPTINYREAFNVSLAKILAGQQEKIFLGNLDARRDWGFAKDYVEAMWLSLQQPQPDDFIFSTGQQYSVRDFVREAFSLCGFDIVWRGSGTDEVGFDKNTNRVLVEVNPSFFRLTEVDTLLGDSSKAQNILNWHPKTTFKELVNLMVESDLKEAGLDPRKFLKPC